MKKRLLALATAFALGGAVGSAHALELFYNSAGSDMAGVDPVTGVLLHPLTQNAGNGRGIVVVGDTVFYTVANSGSVFKRSLSTNVAQGVAFSIAGTSGLQAISFDGTNFWVGDYSGTTKAYLVSPSGTLLKTITLNNGLPAGRNQNIEGFYDGLEFFNGKLIANRFDGGFGGTNTYDVYDLNGNLLTLGFISTAGHGNGTGIAFDGANFYVSNIFNGTGEITTWSGTTGAFIGNLDLAGNHTAIEDLSFDFAARPDTAPSGVSEPGSLALLGLGLVGLVMARRKLEAQT